MVWWNVHLQQQLKDFPERDLDLRSSEMGGGDEEEFQGNHT